MNRSERRPSSFPFHCVRQLLSTPARTVHRAAGTYRGADKADALDAEVIADQARMPKPACPRRRGCDGTCGAWH
ncbi:IS110 family transposase [Streptomyces avermitilis]|uniref:IS110 family transposase n=1 Tax=Streptomyces avermitilis TaxID=33903 RepID=UPI003F4B3422